MNIIENILALVKNILDALKEGKASEIIALIKDFFGSVTPDAPVEGE